VKHIYSTLPTNVQNGVTAADIRKKW